MATNGQQTIIGKKMVGKKVVSKNSSAKNGWQKMVSKRWSPPTRKQCEQEAEAWRKGFLGEEGVVHRKSAVCNFCLQPTDCISTAVPQTAVLKINEFHCSFNVHIDTLNKDRLVWLVHA